jgi:hypothetical protein
MAVRIGMMQAWRSGDIFASVVRIFVAVSWLAGQGLVGSDNAEYQVKAAYLYNFAKLVDWPAPANGPVVIAVFGRDPFGDVLDRTVQGKTIDGRPLVVERLSNLEQLKGCHILFVSAAEKKRLGAILSAVRGEPVLTVGEFEGFLDAGGKVNFTVEQNRIRFDVNLSAARQVGLRISARVLNLARLVRE